MEFCMSRSLSLWPRSEVFSFGVFPMQPHPRLSVGNIKKLVIYAKSKNNTGNAYLKYSTWKHVACGKLGFTEDVAWTYFETCLIMSCPKMEHLRNMESVLVKTVNPTERENIRLQQSINLYTFAIFLYINQICKVSLRSSVASVSGEWPGSPSKGSSFLIRSATKIFKNTSEQYQLQFITDYLPEILDILSDLQPSESSTLSVSCGDKSLPASALDALSFIFEGTIDRLSTIKPIRDILLDPSVISHVGYDKLARTFSLHCIYSWMRANLSQCPFSVESCLLNGTRIQWGMAENKVTTGVNPSPKSYRRPRIVTNVQQLPPSTGFRGNKIVVAEALYKQFIARASRFLKNSTFRLHRANSSFIYLLVPLRCVALDRCRNSTIVLGPIENTLTITDCEDCIIIAPARRVVIWASRRLILHLLCATRPLLLQTSTASSMPIASIDPNSCPPSPLAGVSRRRSPLSNENIIFAPFHTTYPELSHHLDKVALDCNVNYWDKPLLFGSDFWRSETDQRHPSGVWSLLSPDDFFPFNIPLAPQLPIEEAMTQTCDIGANGNENRSMYLKQSACDVCRGMIVSSDRENKNGCKQGQNDLDGSEGLDGEMEFENLDSPAKRTLLLVPLPQAYAEAVRSRRLAYEHWQKTILDAGLSADESVFLSECIETQFKSWLVETGSIKELKILDAASSFGSGRYAHKEGSENDKGTTAAVSSLASRRTVQRTHRHYAVNSTTAV